MLKNSSNITEIHETVSFTCSYLLIIFFTMLLNFFKTKIGGKRKLLPKKQKPKPLNHNQPQVNPNPLVLQLVEGEQLLCEVEDGLLWLLPLEEIEAQRRQLLLQPEVVELQWQEEAKQTWLHLWNVTKARNRWKLKNRRFLVFYPFFLYRFLFDLSDKSIVIEWFVLLFQPAASNSNPAVTASGKPAPINKTSYLTRLALARAYSRTEDKKSDARQRYEEVIKMAPEVRRRLVLKLCRNSYYLVYLFSVLINLISISIMFYHLSLLW